MNPARHRILIVDDEEDVHAITRLSLRGLRYRERRLEFLSATTGREAVEVMRRQPGIAVLLLDVVMESEHAGLEACRIIRNELANPFVRILLRTGQPGAAPEKKVIETYDIDGYLAKGELTSMRLYTAVRTSLKAHGELMDLEALVAERTRELQRQKTENERLLLSILPPAIAERVRRGELRGRFEEQPNAFDEQSGFHAVALSAYIPEDRRQALGQGESLPERAEGSVLFADITGFTPLTETLTEEMGSRRGAEELTSQLDRVYGAMIGEVHRYGGSVIGFSGDAITCWFADDDGRKAVASALNMQRVMGWFAAIETPSGSILPLAVKAAVTRGPVRRLLVGAPRLQRMDLLVGATLDRLTVAASLAHPGEVVVGPRVIEALGDELRLSARSTGEAGERFGVIAGLTARVEESPWPPLSEVPLDEARGWLLPAVAQRLESGQGQFLAELRPTVALFLAFGGLDYETDDTVGAKLDAWIRWVQKTLADHGGALIQLTTGDKGSYLYAAFGAPVAHEDTTERALAAAFLLRSPPAELADINDICIGLSQGRMRAGEYGSETRRTYGVLSDETNLAARLMGKAEAGQILVGARVEASARGYLFRDLGSVPVRGKRSSQAAFEVVGRQPTHAADWSSGEASAYPLAIGRRHEQQQLFDRLEALRRDRAGGLAIVEGEAGIGKTRLLKDLVAEADRRGGVEVVFGLGKALQQATPYYPWRAVLSQLAGDREASEEALSEEQWIERLRRAAQEQPLLVVLENAQWLDAESLQLIRRLRYEVKTLLMAVALRHLAEDSSRLPQDPEVLRLELAPLARNEALALVCRHLEVETVPEPVASLILEKAEGHPWFSQELATALLAQRLIEVEDGTCRLVGDLGRSSVPDAIEHRVANTLDTLKPTEQLTLKVASVVGGIFGIDLLHDIYPVSITRDELLTSLTKLEQLRLLIRESPEPDLSFRVRHRITRDVAYDLLLHNQRRQLHRAVAEWYERRYTDGLDPYYPILAFHWWQALQEVALAEPRLVTKAVDCLAEAGEQALRAGAHTDAVSHVRRGLGLLQSLPRSVERSHLELELRLALARALSAIHDRDAPQIERNAARIAELEQRLEQSGHIPIRFVEQSDQSR
ncbi:MAG: AAA family ATPase [Acidobacteriota bacterium]